MAPIDADVSHSASPVRASFQPGRAPARARPGGAPRSRGRRSPEASASRGPRASGAHEPLAPWSVERTLWLCDEASKNNIPRRAKVLDVALASIAKAVKLLNLGVVYCPADICVAYHAADHSYYLLYRQGCKGAAFEAADEVATASLPSTPRCSTPSCTRPRRDDSGTPPKARGPEKPAAPPQARAASGPGSPQCSPHAVSQERPAAGARSEAAVAEAEPAEGAEEAADLLEVGGRLYRLRGVVGRGAFGVVWRAVERRAAGGEEGPPVAIKAMSASSEEGFGAAVFEAELLRRLGSHLPPETCGRVPRYIGHSAARCDAGGNVHVAMSFLPGQVLDSWLYGISDEAHKHVDVTRVVHGGLPGSRQRSLPLEASCGLVRELLQDLSSVFAALQPLALHRDVSSHNVLVDFGSAPGASPAPSFALIDFGLAVSASSWRREWNTSNLAGDPRYWTLAAWMALSLGFRHVEAHPNRGYQRQYLSRIDHYGLGILSLELLFALWDTDSCQEEAAPGMRQARAAWCAFWELKFRLFQMFHLQGARATQHHLESSPQNPLERLCELLTGVCRSLRAAAAQPANAALAPLLRVLADLVDENGALAWAEVRAALPDGRAAAGAALAAAASPVSPSSGGVATCAVRMRSPPPALAAVASGWPGAPVVFAPRTPVAASAPRTPVSGAAVITKRLSLGPARAACRATA